MAISRSILLRMRNAPDESVEQIKTHILGSLIFFEKSAVYKIMGEIMVQSDRPQMTIWRTRIACWLPKGTNTHSEYVIRIDLHGSSVDTNASQCYVIHILLVLFLFFFLAV